MIDLDLKLLGQLPIHRFDDLPDGVEHALHRGRELRDLIAAGDRAQAHPLLRPEFGRLGGADVGFIVKPRLEPVRHFQRI